MKWLGGIGQCELCNFDIGFRLRRGNSSHRSKSAAAFRRICWYSKRTPVMIQGSWRAIVCKHTITRYCSLPEAPSVSDWRHSCMALSKTCHLIWSPVTCKAWKPEWCIVPNKPLALNLWCSAQKIDRRQCVAQYAAETKYYAWRSHQIKNGRTLQTKVRSLLLVRIVYSCIFHTYSRSKPPLMHQSLEDHSFTDTFTVSFSMLVSGSPLRRLWIHTGDKTRKAASWGAPPNGPMTSYPWRIPMGLARYIYRSMNRWFLWFSCS